MITAHQEALIVETIGLVGIGTIFSGIGWAIARLARPFARELKQRDRHEIVLTILCVALAGLLLWISPVHI